MVLFPHGLSFQVQKKKKKQDNFQFASIMPFHEKARWGGGGVLPGMRSAAENTHGFVSTQLLEKIPQLQVHPPPIPPLETVTKKYAHIHVACCLCVQNHHVEYTHPCQQLYQPSVIVGGACSMLQQLRHAKHEYAPDLE